MTERAILLSVASATAPHTLAQDVVMAEAGALFQGRYREFERLSGVFASSGIRSRQSVRPLDWFRVSQGWPERTQAYLEGADALFMSAARSALDRAGLAPDAVDQVVTVSSTGIATPSLEARVAARLGFRPDVRRTPVFGLGCAGGVGGLSIAERFARAAPGSTVLMVTVELCTLSFRLDALSKANIVATALFGDGAAAAVVSTRGDLGPGLGTVAGAGEHTWPDSLDIMGWRVDPTGFGVIFDRSIPPFAARNLEAAASAILTPLGLSIGDIDRFICHPGGAKVIDALEAALGMRPGRLDVEREVLAAHGNMSAPTVLFVLERLAYGTGLPDRAALLSLGPGFTASALVLERGP